MDPVYEKKLVKGLVLRTRLELLQRHAEQKTKQIKSWLDN